MEQSTHVSMSMDTQPGNNNISLIDVSDGDLEIIEEDLEYSPQIMCTYSMAPGSTGPTTTSKSTPISDPDSAVTPPKRGQFTTIVPPPRRSARLNNESTPVLDVSAMNQAASNGTAEPSRRSGRIRKRACYSENWVVEKESSQQQELCDSGGSVAGDDKGSSQQQDLDNSVESTEDLIQSLKDMDTKMIMMKNETVDKLLTKVEGYRRDTEKSKRSKDEALSIAWETQEKLKKVEAENVKLQQKLAKSESSRVAAQEKYTEATSSLDAEHQKNIEFQQQIDKLRKENDELNEIIKKKNLKLQQISDIVR